ncbi:MAG: hypothetical protein K8R68_06140 [Bacteroidales bacterium]|nr:hypothetical protein [Bacteroidales bacterium]
MSKNKFQNKYRTNTWRHPGWDYSWPGGYFITICTKNRKKYFGDIINPHTNAIPNVMQLSKLGKIAFQYWMEIPNHFPFVWLDAFVIMPDHVHGILILNDNNAEAQNVAPLSNRLPNNRSGKPNRFGPQSNNLASIIRGYKTGVKSYATKNNLNFLWQKRYHDRIIRNYNEFQRIQKYISKNIIEYSDHNHW